MTLEGDIEMPCRTLATRRTVCRSLLPLAGALLLGGWTGASPSFATPFEADGEMPASFAAPMDGPGLFNGGHGNRVGEPRWGGTGTTMGPIVDEGQVVGENVGSGVVATDDGPCHPCMGCQCGGRDCDPPGLIQYLTGCHKECGTCWVGQVDGLLLWRGAPTARPLVESGAVPPTPVLDADQLQSTATGGVRASLLRLDGCCGDAWELAYLYAGNFTAQRILPLQNGPVYTLAPPGIYGNKSSQAFGSGTATLLAQLQTAEVNRHFAEGPNFRWLAGFRWLQWQEGFSLQDTLNDGFNLIDDAYRTDCLNNLYGGQIGADARLFSLAWLRVDSVVKAGAYYNEASQTSTYTTTDPVTPGSATVTVTQSPASCSFVGEVALTGVMPITPNLDFRFGYLGLFLTGLAQPTQQLSDQQVTPGSATVGTLTATGGTIVQGVTLGLEGRW